MTDIPVFVVMSTGYDIYYDQYNKTQCDYSLESWKDHIRKQYTIDRITHKYSQRWDDQNSPSMKLFECFVKASIIHISYTAQCDHVSPLWDTKISYIDISNKYYCQTYQSDKKVLHHQTIFYLILMWYKFAYNIHTWCYKYSAQS